MTVLLDTNVVSELIRKSPAPAVEAWAAGQPLEDLFFSAVGEAELRYGAAILQPGRRRETLVSDIERMLRDAFENRVLPFDSKAAGAYADIAATRRSAGRPDCTGGLPDRGDRPLPRHGGSDTQRPGLRGHRHRGRRPLDGGMSSTTDTLARAGIDTLLRRRSVSPERFVEAVDACRDDRHGRGRAPRDRCRIEICRGSIP